MKRRIRFIINPRSGTGKKQELPSIIGQRIDSKDFDIEICHTEYPRHAFELAAEAVRQGTEIVAVAGGDGTVNEAASALLHSPASLAVIPLGSGNGLARHLSIPLTLSGAIDNILHGRRSLIDSFKAGEHHGFGTFGIGFDAHIAHLFAASRRRGYGTYVKLVLREFALYKPSPVRLLIDGEFQELSPFLLTVANSSQFGNNAVIAPQADIQDGWLDLAVVKPFPLLAAPGLIYRLGNNSLDRSTFYLSYKGRNIRFLTAGATKAHIDGEPVEMLGEFNVEIIPSSIGIIVPSARQSR